MAINVFGGGNQFAPAFPVQRSVRLRSSASAYFNRTLGSGSTTAWTWSGWVKRGYLGANQTTLFFGDSSGTNYGGLYFTSDALYLINRPAAGVNAQLTTTQVFRDPSAWYHIVAVWDTANATSGDRLRLYVNGVRITTFSTATYPALSTASVINTAIAHEIGSSQAAGAGNYYDGYVTEVNFIDGQALTPSSFGSYNSTTGVWQPIKYSGTYGTNGFYLNFNDNSASTAAAIGKDSSGNGNNWTPNNISVTAGVTYDSMLDVPTLTSATNANFATLNPIYTGGATLTNGNLYAQSSSAAYKSSIGTIQFPTSGKYYFEATIVSNNGSGNNQAAGISSPISNSYSFYIDCFATSATSIRKVVDATPSGAYGTAGNGTVIGVAVDADNGKAYLAINNIWIDSSSPTGGTGGYSMTAGQQYAPYFLGFNSGQNAFNFGQQPFIYTPPTGFKSLNTYNLPAPTIPNGATQFAATTYTGNGSTQSITNTVNGKSFQPDLVWYKRRNSADNHRLFDSVRGVTKSLFSDLTLAESTESGVTAFNTNGFTLGLAGNESANTYVGWQWKKGATQGFDIVAQTLGTTGINTINHSLGVIPKMIIAKRRDGAEAWLVYHNSVTTQSQYLSLNSTAAVTASANLWGSSALTSSQFYFNGTSGTQYVFYLFADVAGYSKFGSYTGNGSADGPFVYTGFKPRWVMVKRTDAVSGGWYIWDTSRNTYNATTLELYSNLSNAEATGTGLDIVSNGFKIRATATDYNANGATYIFAAFAESPFNYSLAR